MNKTYHYTVDGLVEGLCDIDELFEDFIAHLVDPTLPWNDVDEDILPF